MPQAQPEILEIPPKFAPKWRLYLEMVRFSHTIFALPFALLAVTWCMALGFREFGWKSNVFTPLQWIGILGCMVTARNFAMTVNRIADRRIDAANPRTAKRHLPAGQIGVREATLFAAMNALGFYLFCICFYPNLLPTILATPVLAFLAGYSFAKRWTSAVHFYLGISLMLAPICVWIALRGEILMQNPVDIVPACLVGAVVCLWVSGFDLIYACQDAEFDRANKVHSIPGKIGIGRSLKLAKWLHMLMFLPLISLPFACPQIGLGPIYWLGATLIAAVLVYEHSIVRENDLSRVNAAFFQANAIISCLFLIAGGLDAWI